MRLLLHTPVSLLLAEYDRETLRSLRFWPQGVHPPADTRDEPARGDAIGHRLALQIEAYFAGTGRDFDLPLRPASTPFRQAVREALCAIPFGEARSYGEIASAIGHPGAARAVGQANASNPYPLIVPCHRVLASGGKLGGYMGDWGTGEGIRIKEWLLAMESRGGSGKGGAGEGEGVGESGVERREAQRRGKGEWESGESTGS